MQQQAIPGARFVDPKILSRVGNLELLARHVVRVLPSKFADAIFLEKELADGSDETQTTERSHSTL